MKIGIMGTTPKAEAIGRLLARGKHDLTFSDPRAPEAAARIAAAVGGSAATQTPYRQVATSDVLIIAVPWEDVDRLLTQMGPVGNSIVINAAVPSPEAHGSGGELLARRLNSPHVVEAFAQMPNPGSAIALCGDDPSSKAVVAQMLSAGGSTTTDLGSLAHAVELEQKAA
jgi:8-hydroxy-5-deazaflavin:NADPH oxidoreductase